jgi:uncharacterized membrane protein
MIAVERNFRGDEQFSSYSDNTYFTSSPSKVNVHDGERLASALGGGLLTVLGIKQRSLGGLALAALGGGLIWRGLSGHCNIYKALGINTSRHKNQHAGVLHGQGIKVEKSVTINKAPEELYRFWRNFENLPRFMDHLEAVRVLDDKRSQWRVKAPLGTTVEWEAEIINEKENELIAWRSVEGVSVPNAGSVRFEKKPGTSETLVKVAISYEPIGGTIGATIAKLFGEEPEQQIEDNLRRFKQVMEAGETASTSGQPSGRSVASGSGRNK